MNIQFVFLEGGCTQQSNTKINNIWKLWFATQPSSYYNLYQIIDSTAFCVSPWSCALFEWALSHALAKEWKGELLSQSNFARFMVETFVQYLKNIQSFETYGAIVAKFLTA